MSELGRLIDHDEATRAEVTALLDDFSPDEEHREVLGLGRRQQERLWSLAGTDLLPVDLEFFVPESATPYQPHVFDGRNSLPAFTRFQKVFYRADDGEVGGFNNQLIMRLTGPGYYVAEVVPERENEVAVNYLETPSTKPPGWPRIVANTRFPSRFIYGGMIDYLRRVSSRSAIGRAYKGGTKEMPNWFVLVRGETLDGLFGYDFWQARKQR